MTYDEWYHEYLTLYKRRIAPKTRESYTRLHQLLTPLHGVQLNDITPDQLQAALIAVEETAGTRQAQLAFTLIHGALRRAVRSRHLSFNPADALDKPEHDARPGRAISAEDWPLLRPELDEPAFALMVYAGLRRGEVLALRRGDIDLEAGVLHVHRQRLRVAGVLVTAPPKSAASVRDVPILPELAEVLRRLPLMVPNALIVPCSPETLARRWRRAQERCGIAAPYRLHDLRHTYATRLVAAGINPRVLQYMIGHASLELTMQTYTHIDGNTALAEVSRIGKSLH